MTNFLVTCNRPVRGTLVRFRIMQLCFRWPRTCLFWTGWCSAWNACDRLQRATKALEAARVPYAVAGGNAVAAWVTTIDIAAVRNTQDVDILLRRSDLDPAIRALEVVDFIHRRAGLEIFLDGVDAKPRDAVHIVIADEKVRPDHERIRSTRRHRFRRAGRFQDRLTGSARADEAHEFWRQGSNSSS